MKVISNSILEMVGNYDSEVFLCIYLLNCVIN